MLDNERLSSAKKATYLGENVRLKSYVEDNQLDQAFAAHERADGASLPPAESTESSSHRATTELAEVRKPADGKGESPSNTII